MLAVNTRLFYFDVLMMKNLDLISLSNAFKELFKRPNVLLLFSENGMLYRLNILSLKSFKVADGIFGNVDNKVDWK